jgi:mono/diheme cytochrome c family protein
VGNIEHRTSNIEGNRNVKLKLKVLYFSLGLGVVGAVNAVNVLAGEKPASPSPAPSQIGRTLYLKNCAHCHAEDAKGDEGPDLHGLDKSDAWIAKRIRNGVKGEMTAFGEKFSKQDVNALIAYLRTLK